MRALAVILLAGLLAAGCGGGGDEAGGTSGSTETAPAGCREAEAPEPTDPPKLAPPQEGLVPADDYRLVFRTSCGTFVVTVDQQFAPKAAASVVYLARKGFYDRTVFHRIVPDFVIQGGDPSQSGTGGPGYTLVDEMPLEYEYAKGTLAMAKSGAEPPGASGSQFFIVTAELAGLDPDYAVVGTVTEGLDVVELIGTLGDASEQPTRPVVVESVTVEQT